MKKQDYDRSIHSNPDASVWAKFFMECKEKNSWEIKDIDEGLMIGWFANAMMAMHDNIYQTKTVIEKTTNIRNQPESITAKDIMIDMLQEKP